MSKQKRIFILDQNRIVGFDLKMQLENNGYVICRQDSFVDLQLLAGQNAPDLIVSDIGIQQQDDFKEVKTIFMQRQLPIICIGTSTNEQATKDCKGINIIGTFSKPFDSKEILELVDQYFDSEQ